MLKNNNVKWGTGVRGTLEAFPEGNQGAFSGQRQALKNPCSKSMECGAFAFSDVTLLVG